MKYYNVMVVQRSLHKALHSNDHDSTDSTNERRRSLVGSTSQMAGFARSYMVQVRAGESKLRSCVTTTGRAKARRQG